jgi:hypothetical protein
MDVLAVLLGDWVVLVMLELDGLEELAVLVELDGLAGLDALESGCWPATAGAVVVSVVVEVVVVLVWLLMSLPVELHAPSASATTPTSNAFS